MPNEVKSVLVAADRVQIIDSADGSTKETTVADLTSDVSGIGSLTNNIIPVYDSGTGAVVDSSISEDGSSVKIDTTKEVDVGDWSVAGNGTKVTVYDTGRRVSVGAGRFRLASKSAADVTTDFTPTALDGDLVYVNTTDATFTRTGIWGRVGSGWEQIDNTKEATTENVSTGAISLDTRTTKFQPAGVETSTLADGTEGQRKFLLCDSFTSDQMTVTPANFANGTTITFDAANESAELQFAGTSWFVVALNGATVA